jgi:tRNASer (uridine44-2'-O)-methyltransferase
VDLGCGNGFLTYLLTMAGHVGCGIDKQKRKIWDIYGGDTTARLVVEEIDPETCEYPGVDWVIGNHSDELTPWLPKIARRCGPGTRYFVIPCCFWDFTRRFSKKAHGQTRYETYLNFIATCGREEVSLHLCVCVCVCVCARACACVRACVRVVCTNSKQKSSFALATRACTS